jgi:hypothetical protein
MIWCVAPGLGAINSPNGGKVNWSKGGWLGHGMSWAGRPGPTSAQLAAFFAWCWFPSLLESFLICMWALAISFSSDWMKLLVPQYSVVSWMGPRSFSSSRVWSLGFLESCLLHFLIVPSFKVLSWGAWWTYTGSVSFNTKILHEH